MTIHEGAEALRAALAHFTVRPPLTIEPLGEGHLHQTYLVQLDAPAGGERLVLQRFNTRVFPDVPAVMDNIARVTSHAREGLLQRGCTDLQRRVLQVRPTLAGATHAVAPDGSVHRAFEYIPGSALAGIERPEQAYEAARVLGEFAQLMADLPAPPLHVTLPDFHATDRRFQQLTAALAADTAGRAGAVQREWREISAGRALADESALLAKSRGLPLRVTHNDTKLNNVLFDSVSGRALCLIDLDTVMPGYVAYDFGDLVRSCVVSEAEDSRELGRSGVRMDVFEAIAQGYLSELGGSLSAVERLSLARGALWIVLELAMRFLTDYLQGDWYFKIARPEHNLERAQAQLQLLAALETRAEDFKRALGAAG